MNIHEAKMRINIQQALYYLNKIEWSDVEKSRLTQDDRNTFEYAVNLLIDIEGRIPQ